VSQGVCVRPVKEALARRLLAVSNAGRSPVGAGRGRQIWGGGRGRGVLSVQAGVALAGR